MGEKLQEIIAPGEEQIVIKLSPISKDIVITQSEDNILIPKEHINKFIEAFHKIAFHDQLKPKYALKFMAAENRIKLDELKGINHIVVSDEVESSGEKYDKDWMVVFNSMELLQQGLKKLKHGQYLDGYYYEIITLY